MDLYTSEFLFYITAPSNLHKENKMKVFIAVAALLMSMVSAADTIKLMEYRDSRDVDVYATTFKVNKPLNRAWVEVTLGESFSDDLHYSDTNVKVPGLSYSPEINGVIYDNGAEEIICGTFYNARWVIDRGMSFRASGRCKFETKKFTKDVDDGFYVRKVKMVQVNLIIE